VRIHIDPLGAIVPAWEHGAKRRSRSPELPDVPTIAEAGLPDYEYVAWFGVFAPGTTRPEQVARISALLRNAVDSPAKRERLRIRGKQLAHTRKERFALISPHRLRRYAGANGDLFLVKWPDCHRCNRNRADGGVGIIRKGGSPLLSTGNKLDWL